LKVSLEGNHFEISLRSGEYLPVKTVLGGTYQVENAALALLSAQALSFRYPRMDLKTVAGGLERTRWRGRLERVRYGDCELVLDGAHNPQGVDALADTFETLGTASEYAVIFTAMKDKALEHMVARICGSFPLVAFTRVPDMGRSAEPDFLLNMSRPYAKKMCDPFLRGSHERPRGGFQAIQEDHHLREPLPAGIHDDPALPQGGR